MLFFLTQPDVKIRVGSLPHLLHWCCFIAERLAFFSYACKQEHGRKWRHLTCLSEAKLSLLVLLDSLYKAAFLIDRGLGATFGAENTSPWSSWSSIMSPLAPPPPLFLPLSPLMDSAAPSSSDSFWRLSASTCLNLLFSSRTRRISMKSSCTCSSLEVNTQIYLCTCACMCVSRQLMHDG